MYKYYLIYQITNLLNGKIYIGKHMTNNKNDNYMGSGTMIMLDIKKYGKENFKKDILFECKTEDEMNAKEAELVNKEFLKRDDVYNMAIGGYGSTYNKNLSQEEIQKRRHAGGLKVAFLKSQGKLPIYKFTEKDKELISLQVKKHWKLYGHNWTGKKHKQSSKDKIGKANANAYKDPTKNPAYGKCWIYNLELQENKSVYKKDLEKWLNERLD